MSSGKLYLIPTPIAETDNPMDTLPELNKLIVDGLSYFVVENLRTARRFISSLKLSKVIDDLTLVELSEHTPAQDVEAMIAPLLRGESCGVMSEAGVPGVADPGADIVAIAHRHNIEVIPLVGPSSIILSLMASGMNGQSFCFNGYLPIKGDDKLRKIKELERLAKSKNQTQIFIEAPYRADKLFTDLIKELSPDTLLCVASNITAKCQYIKTKSVSVWRKSEVPNIKKVPTIFLVG